MLKNPTEYKDSELDANAKVALAELRVLLNSMSRQLTAVDTRSYNNALLLAGMTAKFGFLAFGVTAIMNLIMGSILYLITRGVLQQVIAASGG